MEGMIHVGVSKETVDAARELIVKILESGACDAVQLEALKTAASICQVNNLTIKDCTFTAREEAT